MFYVFFICCGVVNLANCFLKTVVNKFTYILIGISIMF